LTPDAAGCRGTDELAPSPVRYDARASSAPEIWLRTDRAKMNAAIFDALASGGAFVVIDSSARPGMGVDEAAYELHRVGEKLVRDEVQAAGFRLAGESAFLRNAADGRDWNPAPNEAGEHRGTSDRFALRFVKP